MGKGAVLHEESKAVILSIAHNSLSKILEEIKNLGLQDLDNIFLDDRNGNRPQQLDLVSEVTNLQTKSLVESLVQIPASEDLQQQLLGVVDKKVTDLPTEQLLEGGALHLIDGIDVSKIKNQRDLKQYNHIKTLLQDCQLSDFSEDDQRWIVGFVNKIKEQQNPQYQEKPTDIYHRLELGSININDLSVYAPMYLCQGGVEFKRFKQSSSDEFRVNSLTIQYGELKTYNGRQPAVLIFVDGKGIILPSGEINHVGNVKTHDRTDQRFVDESRKQAQDIVDKINNVPAKYLTMDNFLENNYHFIKSVIEPVTAGKLHQ